MSKQVSPPPVHDLRHQSPDDGAWLIVIAASAGGLQALEQVLRNLPADLKAAIVIVQHRSPVKESLLETILARHAHVPVVTATWGQRIDPGTVYIARPDLHLTINNRRRFAYIDGTRIRGVLSSANPLFQTAAATFHGGTIAVVLSGSGTD